MKKKSNVSRIVYIFALMIGAVVLGAGLVFYITQSLSAQIIDDELVNQSLSAQNTDDHLVNQSLSAQIIDDHIVKQSLSAPDTDLEIEEFRLKLQRY